MRNTIAQIIAVAGLSATVFGAICTLLAPILYLMDVAMFVHFLPAGALLVAGLILLALAVALVPVEEDDQW